MLTTPNSLYKTGMAVGVVWAVGCALVSLYTMYLLSALYLERKRSMVS
jgi:amino acid permease